jgi:hypothetical protein
VTTECETVPTGDGAHLVAASAREEVEVVDLEGLHAEGALHLLFPALVQD